MDLKLSRRGFITYSATGAAVVAAGGAMASGSGTANPDLLPLTSRSGVYTPPRGDAVMQFSFDFPEASVQVGPFLVSFRVQTFENAYAIDPAATIVSREGNRVRVACSRLLWAGGQESMDGSLTADFTIATDGVVEWRAEASAPSAVKSITTVLRGLPRGELSVSAGAFTDPGDDEKLFEYPYLFGGMSTPLVMLKAKDGTHYELSARQDSVLPARFFFQPGPDGYRVELIHEAPGWNRRARIVTPPWRVGPTASYAAAAAGHFDHVERTYGIPPLKQRPDAPSWMQEIDLVLSIHGAHWTGYIFNDYKRILDTIIWAAPRMDPRRVMVFLPAWDGRYYWNYPLYQPDPRMGGVDGFRRLMKEGQRLGYKMVPMFGTNSANATLADFKQFADATSEHIDGDSFDLNWVDWDNDRANDGWMPFMNLGVESWRRFLTERISATIGEFGPDAYFLDIAGGWVNNRKGDMNVGTRLMVEELRRRHPGIPPIGEMLYDAQMAYIPMSQVTRYALHPAGQDAYIRSYEHLSRPAPGRGSTGVHEAGFGRYKPDIAADQRAIPTITIVDDTLEKEQAAMERYIRQAKEWGDRRRRG